MTRSDEIQRDGGESGFILPAVVMFVVVLTILGLSLFSLSSYEARFMNTSLDRSEAFYLASGGLDRARYLLTIPPYDLATVSTDLGTGIITAQATQPGNPSGQVQWNGQPVEIWVEAEKNGQRRILEARFNPVWSAPYDNLFSMSATTRGLEVSQAAPTWAPNENSILTGALWQTYHERKPPPRPPNYDYYEDIYPIDFANSSLDTLFGSVPAPEVSAFWSANEAGKDPPAESGPPGQNEYLLDATGYQYGVRFYKNAGGVVWSKEITGGVETVTFEVRGIVVWMFEKGLFVDRKAKVVPGTGNDMLVLCAKKTNDPSLPYGADAGIVFRAGLDSPNVPIIMVSDGYVAVDNVESGGQEGTVPSVIGWLSIFAHFAWIEGPKNPMKLVYSHGPDANAEANLQTLLDNGYLPNASGQRRQLAYIPGTWQEIPPN